MIPEVSVKFNVIFFFRRPGPPSFFDDDVLNEDWIKYCMVRSHRLLSLVLVAIGVGRRISKRK
jgi:hypothetical protein